MKDIMNMAIKPLSREKKLHVMETIWEDLSEEDRLASIACLA
jgi:hypothetical protein